MQFDKYMKPTNRKAELESRATDFIDFKFTMILNTSFYLNYAFLSPTEL